jgi:hypothetical protein
MCLVRRRVFAAIIARIMIEAAPRLILRSRPYDPPALRMN